MLSKHFKLRMEESTWEQVETLAEKEERSINSQILYLIKRGLEREKKAEAREDATS